MIQAGPAVFRDLALGGVILVVLALPLISRGVERNLEAFLLLMGAAAATIASRWSLDLAGEAIGQPVQISVVVLAVGLAFHASRAWIDRGLQAAQRVLPWPVLAFLIVAALGVLSGIVTAIVAALILVEVVHVLCLDRKLEVRFVVLGCYSIGLGAALTPVGGPLSAIVTANLHESFWFIGRLVGSYIMLGILVLAAGAACLRRRPDELNPYAEERHPSIAGVFIRAVRVYTFVAGLILLGVGLSPLVDRYVARWPGAALFWINAVSAVLDNAAVAAAEIGPSLSRSQMSGALLGLLISGGMLIPGNIPNIIAAHRLKIGSAEWARFAVPVGVILMSACFCLWLAVG